MELNWLQSLTMGLVSGLTDILPVSSQAHRTLLFTFFGGEGNDPLTRLVIHAATLITVLVACWGKIARIRRQLRLVRLPRRRRTRQVDMTVLMDVKILRTALVPVLVSLLLYGLLRQIHTSLFWLAVLSLINAVILYLPGLFPTADKDSRLVTPAESLLMGLGTGIGIVPGLSSVGTCYSVGIMHGVDRRYMIHLTLMMYMMFSVGMIFYDVLDILSLGGVSVGGVLILKLALTAAAAVVGALLGLRMLRAAAQKAGLTGFSFYSFGLALFSFILYLVV